MFSKSRRGFYTLLLSATAVSADAGGFEIIESSLGDRLEISALPDDRATPHIIEACLVDVTGGEAKGFDIRQDQTPRYVTRDRQPVCAELFAGAHQLVFWRASLGQFQPIVSIPLDLSGRVGERLWITWRIDGSIAGAGAPDLLD